MQLICLRSLAQRFIIILPEFRRHLYFVNRFLKKGRLSIRLYFFMFVTSSLGHFRVVQSKYCEDRIKGSRDRGKSGFEVYYAYLFIYLTLHCTKILKIRINSIQNASTKKRCLIAYPRKRKYTTKRKKGRQGIIIIAKKRNSDSY